MFLPVGPDWADGVSDLPAQPQGASGSAKVGTPAPLGARTVNAPNNGTEVTVEEETSSPEIERAEQGTFQHRLQMSYEAAIGYLGGLGRGTFVQDSGRLFGIPTVWRILSAKAQRKRGNVAELSYTAESISFDSPPDEYDLQTADLGLDILKHPRYAWALNPTGGDDTTGTPVGDITVHFTDIKSSIIRLIQSYRDSPFFPSVNQINGLVQTNIMSQLKSGKLDVHYNNPDFNGNPVSPTTIDTPVRWNGVNPHPTANCPYFIVSVPVDITNDSDPIAIALAAAKEIISKLWRGEDTPYIPTIELRWTQYFFASVYLNLGGYPEDPVGIVPDYFIDPNQDGSDNIFSQLSKICPQLYSAIGSYGGPVNISWLRKADRVDYQRTWFKVDHIWIGSPIGTWDPDLYTTANRPQRASDFSQLI